MLTATMGYAYAKAMDNTINKALKNYPISDPENYAGYAVLIRTIQTTLNIAEKENNEHLPRCPACGSPR